MWAARWSTSSYAEGAGSGTRAMQVIDALGAAICRRSCQAKVEQGRQRGKR